MATDEPSKGGRPTGPDGPKDDSYAFRGPSHVLKAFERSAGRDRGSVLIQFMRWWLRFPGAELPQRPPAITDKAA
ncbi:hypothetical protein [Lentzea cavernae]|uniref:Uncharacterized protein n=1 Tax=Lentzea cavernae TaxID=2020703 RepID=A0ABQ3N0S2_9PSEU|nr:hypothetical protein [Lentzea cavernae]GHH57501.1 hypothetical protein GCM10017774_77090 [Lentzea cavernae]